MFLLFVFAAFTLQIVFGWALAALAFLVAPEHLVVFIAVVVFGLVCAIAGYSLRGAIRREIGLFVSDVEKLRVRLENAAKLDVYAAEAEIKKILEELRAKL